MISTSHNIKLLRNTILKRLLFLIKSITFKEKVHMSRISFTLPSREKTFRSPFCTYYRLFFRLHLKYRTLSMMNGYFSFFIEWQKKITSAKTEKWLFISKYFEAVTISLNISKLNRCLPQMVYGLADKT